MDLRPIRNEKDYQNALNRLEAIFDAKKGTNEGDELEILSILIENYENQNFPIEMPDPIEAIKFRMEQMGLSRKDLESLIGSRSKVSEILNRKRKLSLPMIRRLHAQLGIPAEILISDS